MSLAKEENLVLCDATLVGGAIEISGDQLKMIVDATADAGFRGVSLWAFHHLAAVGGGATSQEVRAWHEDRGLSVPIVESLIGWETGDPATIEEQCGPTFEVASYYGAKKVAGVVMATEIDFDAATRGLAELARMGHERGLDVCIEWLPWSGLPDLRSAWRLIQAADAENLGLVIDGWHWLRQPGGPDEETLRSIPGERIHCVQMDDTTATASGDDPMMESMTNRLLPGEGEVDWPALLGILEEIGADPIWAPEVFNVALLEEGPVSMARRIRDATRKVLGL
ncbi:MAG TPA: sugar phosphate isomerase/epimerase [Deltaproteobacteria bacterium]|nr:sugar phosphate isomerase/epimerase [Deltaproteobacteria bacterium]